MRKFSLLYMITTISSVLLTTNGCGNNQHIPIKEQKHGSVVVEREDSAQPTLVPLPIVAPADETDAENPHEPAASNDDPAIEEPILTPPKGRLPMPPKPKKKLVAAGHNPHIPQPAPLPLITAPFPLITVFDHWNKIGFGMVPANMVVNFYMSNDCQHLYLLVKNNSDLTLWHHPANSTDNNWLQVALKQSQNPHLERFITAENQITSTTTGLLISFKVNKKFLQKQTYAYKIEGTVATKVDAKTPHDTSKNLSKLDINTIQNFKNSSDERKQLTVAAGYRTPDGEAFIYVQGQGIFVGKNK